jgi:hypothetical protein
VPVVLLHNHLALVHASGNRIRQIANPVGARGEIGGHHATLLVGNLFADQLAEIY